ncbi:MAG: cbb3-type cytochrome c oxidase subunit 3 [Polyangiaceae bacterium]|nr:cbb3-type cytochrome c oxidase subunit 3 [Polyangiaceae bacterium]
MKLSEIMSNMGLTSYAEIGLLIFFAVFIAVVFRVYSKKHQSEYEAARLMPLDDELVRTPRDAAGEER